MKKKQVAKLEYERMFVIELQCLRTPYSLWAVVVLSIFKLAHTILQIPRSQIYQITA